MLIIYGKSLNLSTLRPHLEEVLKTVRSLAEGSLDSLELGLRLDSRRDLQLDTPSAQAERQKPSRQKDPANPAKEASDTRAKRVSLAQLASTAPQLTRDIELLLLNQSQMRALNSHALGRDYATDVLSFPLLPLESILAEADEAESPASPPATSPSLPLGSIAINLPLARKTSRALGHSLYEEIALLFLHGVLHLLGFNHEDDNGEQRELESLLIQALALPPSLTHRATSPHRGKQTARKK